MDSFAKVLAALTVGVVVFVLSVTVGKLTGLFPFVAAVNATFILLVLFFAPMGKRNDDGTPDDLE